MSTPLDYAEFYFGHVDKEHEMTKPEGVAAPLEPAKLTPRLFYESWRCAHYAGITQVTQIEQLVFFVATIALLVIYGFWADKREHR